MSTNEGVRLAQELHDGIAQDLVGMGYCIDSLVGAVNTPHEIRSQLRTLRFAVSELVEKVRDEIFALRESAVVLPYEASPSYELQKIFAELLRNVQEHSRATSITMTLYDNGIGGVREKTGHHGLVGIGERVRGLDGDLAIHSSDRGTQISITVPWVRP
ncbi:MAG: histidine kinase [Actinomycetota bacterium]|nr:histidine kinase [Actinomycetota bacterium]